MMLNRPLSRRATIKLAAGGVLLSAATPALAETRYIVIGTGGTGGVFYPYGGGLAALLSKKLPDTQATAEVTGGSVDNVKLLGQGNAEIGFSTVDSAYDGLKGTDAYKDVGPQPIATLAVLYQSSLHVVATKASGIKSIADIKGKRASVGSAGSSTESIADRTLAAAGLDPMNDVTRDNLGVSESVAALKDGKIDVFFWIGGVPTPAVKDIVTSNAGDVEFIATGDLAAKLTEKYPSVYAVTSIKKEAYAGLAADLPVLGVANVLIASQKADDKLVTDVLTAIFDNLADVQAIHPSAKRLSLEGAAKPSAVPFHPAALAFYKSRGVAAN
jgi:TRAP transporter TAXI family solute receptor